MSGRKELTDLDAAVTAVLEEVGGLNSSSEHVRAALVAVQTAQDKLDGAKAKYLRELESSRAYEDGGASSHPPPDHT